MKMLLCGALTLACLASAPVSASDCAIIVRDGNAATIQDVTPAAACAEIEAIAARYAAAAAWIEAHRNAQPGGD